MKLDALGNPFSLKVKFKKLRPDAFTPRYAKYGDAGLDLVAMEGHYNNDYGFLEYSTGICVEIPEGYVGYLFPRSSISKTPHSLRNSVGVIDSGYRGEIKLRFSTDPEREHLEYQYGDKIGQLVIMPIPQVEMVEMAELSSSDRGEDGFGSTGG